MPRSDPVMSTVPEVGAGAGVAAAVTLNAQASKHTGNQIFIV
ncbi:MAG TPA: hypothetical protein VHW25_13620 [Steroidobacteraceae bacterium]|jgi:hypothetical protein|nr:hypothetical protein [Steroidobacteraceae bacterium]